MVNGAPRRGAAQALAQVLPGGAPGARGGGSARPGAVCAAGRARDAGIGTQPKSYYQRSLVSSATVAPWCGPDVRLAKAAQKALIFGYGAGGGQERVVRRCKAS